MKLEYKYPRWVRASKPTIHDVRYCSTDGERWDKEIFNGRRWVIATPELERLSDRKRRGMEGADDLRRY